MKKLISILVAFAMMASLAVSMAFALDDTAVEGSIYFTKKLNVANDIDASELDGTVTINFDFTGATGLAATNESQVTDKTAEITITATNDKEANGAATTSYYYTTANLDAAFFGLNTDATKPGVYTYDVTETNAATANRETEQYTGSETDKHITLTILKDKTGVLTFTASVVGEDGKITIVNTKEDLEDIKGNGLAFENNLFDIIDTEGYENSKFKFNKTVTDTANLYNGEAFEFSYYVTIPEGADPATTVELVYNVDGTAGNDVTLDGEDINVDGTVNTLSLKDGGYAYFNKLPSGSSVKASETDTTYTADSANGGKNFYTTDRGMTQAVTLDADTDAAAEVENISVAETTMEGILHNSIPYIVLALVAIGGMAAYIVIRRRNADEA